LQGGQLSDGPGAPMLLSSAPGSSMHGSALLEPLSATTTTVQNAAPGDV